MRRAAIIITVMFIFLSVSALIFAESGVSAGKDQGKTLYENNCADCHGVSGKGDGPSSRALGAPPTNLAESKFWGRDAEKRVRSAVRNGYGAMPPLDLRKDELNAVYSYMSGSFRK